WGDGQYGSRNGSWGWQGRQGSKWKGGQYHKGGGGRKGKGKGGHRWHDVESMRDLPIQRFVQDDMVEDPWTSLYPRLKEEHPDLYDEYAKYLDDQRSSPQRPELPCYCPCSTSVRNGTRLQEQRDSVVLRDKLRRLSMVDDSGPEELLESLDSANRLATEAYHRSHMLSER
ncbi:hypothetical protein FOZ62_012755, partial [Perkinsus olseni]